MQTKGDWEFDWMLKHKTLSYTTRFNAFWNDDNRPDGWTRFASDGEAIDIDNYLKE